MPLHALTLKPRRPSKGYIFRPMSFAKGPGLKIRSLEYPGEHKNFLFDPKEDPRGVALRSQMKNHAYPWVGSRANPTCWMHICPSIRSAVRPFHCFRATLTGKNEPILARPPDPVRPLALVNRESSCWPSLAWYNPRDGGTGSDRRTGSHGRP